MKPPSSHDWNESWQPHRLNVNVTFSNHLAVNHTKIQQVKVIRICQIVCACAPAVTSLEQRLLSANANWAPTESFIAHPLSYFFVNCLWTAYMWRRTQHICSEAIALVEQSCSSMSLWITHRRGLVMAASDCQTLWQFGRSVWHAWKLESSFAGLLASWRQLCWRSLKSGPVTTLRLHLHQWPNIHQFSYVMLWETWVCNHLAFTFLVPQIPFQSWEVQRECRSSSVLDQSPRHTVLFRRLSPRAQQPHL